MSAKTLLVNEGLLQEIESRVGEIRAAGKAIVQKREKMGFVEGLALLQDYDESVSILQDVAKQLFAAVDVQDPDDGELQRREEEDEEESEDEEGDEDEDDEDDEDEGDDS